MNKMGNPQKNDYIYQELVQSLEAISKDKAPSVDFPKQVDRAYISFINGFKPKNLPLFDYGAQVISDLSEYARLFQERKNSRSSSHV